MFAIAFIDSAGISLPGAKDLLLIYLCAKRPGLAWLYALGAVVATMLGTLVIYGLGRSGARLLGRKPSRENVSRARRWLQRHEFVTIVVASLLPPPLPFKPVSFAAGVMRIRLTHFIFGLLVGGAIRFGVEAWFGVRYGVGGEEYLKRNMLWLSLAAVAIIVALALVNYVFRRTPADSSQPPGTPQP